MRSLQLKLSALVATLLVITSISLVWFASRHERAALEAEVEKRALALATNLAGDAEIPLLEEDKLALETLVQQIGEQAGVIAARVVKPKKFGSGNLSDEIVASLSSDEQGMGGHFSLASAENPNRTMIEQRGDALVVAAPVVWSDVQIGEAQIELDLGVLVTPVVAEAQRQLAVLAFAVVLLGVVVGIGFVALLLGPSRRLQA